MESLKESERKLEKHELIVNSVDTLKVAVHKLENLCNKICIGHPAKETAPEKLEKSQMSLENVLDSTPDAVNQVSKEISDIITKMEESLF